MCRQVAPFTAGSKGMTSINPASVKDCWRVSRYGFGLAEGQIAPFRLTKETVKQLGLRGLPDPLRPTEGNDILVAPGVCVFDTEVRWLNLPNTPNRYTQFAGRAVVVKHACTCVMYVKVDPVITCSHS